MDWYISISATCRVEEIHLLILSCVGVHLGILKAWSYEYGGEQRFQMIDVVQWRASIGSYHCRSGCIMMPRGLVTVASSLCYSVCSTVLAILLLCCGDIESNPGPLGIQPI